ncbi:hypothetical protein [Halorubrum ezzemoulense]|uniref:hypothetical protein n=1 Tax=Halorubrum ezzemoulense TaxID=337243 RepID=UPI0023303228|nr:hypothetical protein [Halorubrum ezzemoulense]
MNRRNVLLGLGTAAAGSGAVFGSGAFTQVEADRSITVGVSGDSSAQVQLEAKNVTGVNNDGGDNGLELQINETSLNSNATIEFGSASFDSDGDVSSSAFTITNNTSAGTGSTALDFEITPDPNDNLDTDESITLALDDDAETPTKATVTGGSTNSDFKDITDSTSIKAAVQLETDEDNTDLSTAIRIKATDSSV